MRHVTAHIALAIILAACALHPALTTRGASASDIRRPAAAAQQLYSAYKSCNRAAALKVATATAVNKLFGNRCRPGDPKWQFMGCERSGRAYLCSYYYEGGAANMRVRRQGTAGYRVVSVGFIAD